MTKKKTFLCFIISIIMVLGTLGLVGCDDACEHAFDDGTITKIATCTEKGAKTFTCSKCGETKTEEIELSDHNYENKYDAINHFKKCSACGDKKEVHAHNFEEGACADCDYAYTTGMVYEIDSSGETTIAKLTGIGTAGEVEDVVIPAYYKGVPVTRVYGNNIFNENLKTITIPNTIKVFALNVFSSATALEKTIYLGTLEEWVQMLIGSSFSSPIYQSKNLYIDGKPVGGDLDFTNSNVQFGKRSLLELKDIKSIKFGKDVTFNVGEGLLFNSSVENVEFIDSTIEQIAYDFFGHCHYLKNIILPDTIKSIGSSAFTCCYDLEWVVVGDDITSIGNLAFNSCNKLTKVFYKGTIETMDNYFNTIYASPSYNTTENGNKCFTDATKYAYSETQPAVAGNYWHFVNGVPTVWEVAE